jgi:hypothetical protein
LIISRFFSDFFGINPSTLQLLTILPIVFCNYSACCYLLIIRGYKPFILIIAIANFLYCLITMVLIFTHYSELTILGLSYFILELMIIGIIVYLEFDISSKFT